MGNEPSVEAVKALLSKFITEMEQGPCLRFDLATEALKAAYAIDFAALQAENERLKDEVNTRYELAQERLGVIEDLRTELQQAREEIGRLKTQVGAWDEFAAQKQGEIEGPGGWKDLVQMLRKSEYDLQQQLAQSQADLIEQRHETARAFESFETANARADGMQRRLDESQAENAALKAQFNSVGIVPYLDRMKELADKRDALQARLDEANKLIDRMVNVREFPDGLTRDLAAHRKAAEG